MNIFFDGKSCRSNTGKIIFLFTVIAGKRRHTRDPTTSLLFKKNPDKNFQKFFIKRFLNNFREKFSKIISTIPGTAG
jgi:hypothetical protein